MRIAPFKAEALLLLSLAPSLWAASTALDLDEPFFRNTPKDLAMIPASARWAAYVDLSDPKQAEFGRGLFRTSVLPSLEIDATTGERMKQVANDLTSMTLYGGSLAEAGWQQSPVAILEGHPILADHVRAALRARIKAAPGSITTTNRSLSVEGYALRSSEQPGGEPVYVAFPADSHFVVVSKSIPQLEEAIRAPYRRQHDPVPTDSGSDALSINTLLTTQGNVLLRAAIESPSTEGRGSDTDSQLLKLTHTAKLFVTLEGSRVHASLHVQAPNEETAGRLSQIMQGLIAMYALSGRSGDWSQVLSSASVHASGNDAIVEADYPVARLLALAARQQPQPKPLPRTIDGMDSYGRQVGFARSSPSPISHHSGDRQTHVFMHVTLLKGDVITVGSHAHNPDSRDIPSLELVPVGDNGSHQVLVPMALLPGSDKNGDDRALYQGTFAGEDGRYDLVFLTIPDEVDPVAYDVRVAGTADRNP